MKKLARIMVLLALSVAIFAVSTGATPGTGADAFEKLKSLAGHWEANPTTDMKATLDIEVTSGGSVVLERSRIVEKNKSEEMITMYYIDGGQVKLTHYCGAGNQPTMRGTYSPETNTLTFEFISATNLKSPNDGYMHHAIYTFLDNDHFKTSWTFRKDQKDAFTEDAVYVRVK